jgi:AraC-like DNA-binding protein
MSVILELTLLFSLVMALIALFNSRQNPKVHLSFMALMLCFFLLLGELALIQWKLSSINLFWFCFSSPATVAIPPCFYLYFRASLRLEGEFELKDGLHFILPGLFSLMMVPYGILSMDEKRTLFTALYNNSEALPWYQQITPTREIRMGVVSMLGAFYIQLCWHELNHESSHKKADVLREVNRFRWAILVMGAAIGCTLIFFMVRLPFEHTWVITSMVVPLVICIGLLYWRLPQWGHRWWMPPKGIQQQGGVTFKPIINSAGGSGVDSDDHAESDDDKKYRSSVTLETAENTMKKLQNLMEAGLYKDSTLTLRKLAHELDLSQHHLSQIINEQTQASYYDLLNQYRISEAKRLLTHSNMSVIDITYEAGFNSKSSFYTEFKRQNNCTPGQFKQKATSTES